MYNKVFIILETGNYENTIKIVKTIKLRTHFDLVSFYEYSWKFKDQTGSVCLRFRTKLKYRHYNYSLFLTVISDTSPHPQSPYFLEVLRPVFFRFDGIHSLVRDRDGRPFLVEESGMKLSSTDIPYLIK